MENHDGRQVIGFSIFAFLQSIDSQLLGNTHNFALQNAAFWPAKPCILARKMQHIAAQNHAYCKTTQ